MRKNKEVVIILVFLFVSNIFAWLVVYNLSQPQFLEVTFFDVGQGDSIFIETPKRHQILIDGGPDLTVLEKLGKEMPFYDRTIDLIILTHPEKDHLGGLFEVLKRYKVENILWTGVIRDTAEFKEWQRLIKKEKVNIFIAQAGQKIKLQRSDIYILFPFENLEGKEFKNSNNTSIIAKLVFGQNSFLFTGDIYKSIEKKLLGLVKQQLDSDILKVAHHGSKTSSDSEFIKKVSPEFAVIQCGKDNSYGHPHPETLETLRKYGIKIFRTDLDGDIKIISNGENYEISHF
jgi:competence protein ComEC